MIAHASQQSGASYSVSRLYALTLTPQTITFTTNPPASPAVNSFYAFAATGGASGNAVTFTLDAASTGCTFLGGAALGFSGPGTCLLNANQAGNANYAAAPQVQQSITIASTTTQTITFNRPADVTFGASPVGLGATASSGLAVSYSSSTASVCTISGTSAQIVGAGTCTVTASQAGNGSYAAATPVPQSFNVAKANQAISFTSTLPAAAAVGTTYAATATGGGSNNAVAFAINSGSTSGACTISGSTVSLTGVGLCIIDAYQAGNDNYNGAPIAQQSMLIGKGTQTIAFTSPVPASPATGGTYAVAATGGASGNAVTFAIDAASTAGACSMSNATTVSFAAAGTCIVNANQAGNTNYNNAAQVQQTMTVGRGSQTIAFTSTASSPLVGGSYAVTATGGASGNAVTFSIAGSSGSGVCTISGSTVSFAAAGSCVIAADQAGNANYSVATQALQTVTVGKGNQAITFTSNPPSNTTLGVSYTVTATGGATGNAVTFSIDGASTAGTCSISGASISFTAAGTCIVNANQLGNNNYNPAAQAQQSIAVGKAGQTITFTSPAPANPTFGSFYAFSATGGASGNPVTFALGAGSAGCTMLGNTAVGFTGAGTCIIVASQAGSTNYNAASPAEQRITLNKTTQTISFAKPADLTWSAGATVALTASATSGLAVSLTSTTAGVCTVLGTTATVVTAGTCSITASQAGDATYGPAGDVIQSFAVNQVAQTVAFSTQPPAAAAVGTYYAYAASGGASGNPVTFSIDAASTSGACAPIGGAAAIGFNAAGTCILNANQAGTTNYAAAQQVQQTITIAKAPQTISFARPADQATNVTSVVLSASATSGLAVSFASTTAATCSVSGATVTLVGIGGICSITASQAGNAAFQAAASVVQSFNIGKTAQTISFTRPADQTFMSGATVALSASATSALAVTLASTTTSVCTVSGSTATLVAAGACTITASQAGNASFGPAADVSQTFGVGKASQSIAFLKPADIGYTSGTTVALTASASSGLAVGFASTTTSVCTVSGATVAVLTAGTCTLAASQAGDANYIAAADVSQSFAIGQTTQTITFTRPADGALVGAAVALSATASSGLAISFGSTTTSVCTVSGSTATIVGAGTCTVTASQAGNASYAAATDVSQSFSAGKTAQTISFTKPADAAFTSGGTVALSATATSGLAVSFASTTASVCTVSGSTATIVSTGTCSITASQAGNTTYSAASDVTQSFAIGKTGQTISFTKPSDALFTTGATVALTATASSGLAVTLTSQTTGVCTVSGSTATIVTVGTCTVKASQAGNANYAAAADVTVSFGALSLPAISATGSVNPRSISSAGVPLAFTFTLVNSGGVAATNVRMTGARFGTITCAATTIPAGGSTTCQSSITSTLADITARRISISPQVSYGYAAPTSAANRAASASATDVTVSVSVTISVDVDVSVDVSAVQRTTRSAIHAFLGQRANVITSTGPDSARAHARLEGGTLFGGVDNTPQSGWSTSIDGNSGVGRPRLGPVGTSLGYDGTRSAGLGNAGTSMSRAGLGGTGLASMSAGSWADAPFGGGVGAVDRIGMMYRGPGMNEQGGLVGSQFGRPFGMQRDYVLDEPRRGPSSIRFSGSHDEGSSRFQFSTSLSQIQSASRASDEARLATARQSRLSGGPIGSGGDTGTGAIAMLGYRGGHTPTSRPGSMDVWVEGASTSYSSDRIDGRRKGSAYVIHGGVDFLMTHGLLVGLMGSYDSMSDSGTGGTVTKRDGTGWMAGPYMSARLTNNIYFDARATWGLSNNNINPLGVAVDAFTTSRSLMSAKLTGDWMMGAFRFRPSGEVTWFSEATDKYRNKLGVDIPVTSYSVGRATFGPEVGYRFHLPDHSVFEPFLGFKGVHDFSRTQETTAAGTVIAPDGMRGRVEAGMSFRTPAGTMIRASGAYDGIGSTNGYSASQGQATLVMPLQ